MSEHPSEIDAILGTVGRRERKKEATRRAIEDTARQLFSQHGFAKTSVLDITEAVDVAERTFYRYFTSKEDVLFGPWRQDLDLALGLIESRPPSEDPLEAMRGGCGCCLGSGRGRGNSLVLTESILSRRI